MALNDIQYFEPNSTDYMRMKDDCRISLTRLEGSNRYKAQITYEFHLIAHDLYALRCPLIHP